MPSLVGFVLSLLVLWVSTANAFFAYCPSWHDGCGTTAGVPSADVKLEGRASPARTPLSVPGVLTFELGQRAESATTSHHNPDKLAREVTHLVKKFARLRTPELVARENKYNIELPTEPTMGNAVGIAQDGTDFSYFAVVGLGSKGKKLYMLTDTGAGTSWVMGSDCTSSACAIHNSFGPADSATFNDTGKPFTVGYSTGSVAGQLVRDTVSVADITLDFEFGVAYNITEEFNYFPFDGILGLARNGARTTAFLAAVKEAGLLPANIMGFYLNRASDGPNNGELSFGAVNPEKFSGKITYTPLVRAGGDWIIEAEGVSFNGERVIGAMPAYIDTGTTYMFGPPETVARLHSTIPGAQNRDNISWTVPCDTVGVPSLVFSGVEFPISRDDWLSPPSNGVCISNIYGIGVLPDSWLIGGTFLKNAYSVFDSDQARIGFAKKVVPSISKKLNPTATTDPISETGNKNPGVRPGLSGPEGSGPTGSGAKPSDDPTSAGASTPVHVPAGDAVCAALACVIYWLFLL